MDRAVGAILEKVKQIGRERNTLVMFLSDNAPRRFCPIGRIHIPKKTTKAGVSVGNDPQTMPEVKRPTRATECPGRT